MTEVANPNLYGMTIIDPEKPIKISDLSESDYTKLSVYRRMIEIGLESVIFSNCEPNEFFNHENQTLEDLKRQHQKIQDSFDKLMKDVHRHPNEKPKIDKTTIAELMDDYKTKVFKFLNYLASFI